MKSKDSYLRQLKRILIWKEETDELNEILNDCNEYFEVGIEKGKTEEEMCASLGNPRYFIQGLDLKKRGFKSIKFKAMYALMIPMLYSLVFANIFNDNIWGLFVAIFSMLVVINGVWRLLGKDSFCVSYLSKDRKCFRISFIYHSIIILMQILMMSLLVFGNKIALPYIGIYIVRVLYGIMIINSIIMLKGLYNYRVYSNIYYSLYIHTFGAIICIIYNIRWLHLLSDVEDIYTYIIKGCFIYVIILFITVYFNIYENKKNNKKVIYSGRSI